MTQVKIRTGVKLLKGATKIAGPAALIALGSDIWGDYNTYSGESRKKAMGLSLVAAALAGGVGFGLGVAGAPIVLSVLAGAAAGTYINSGVEQLKANL